MTYRPAVYCVNPGCHEPYRAELPACPECDTPTRPPLAAHEQDALKLASLGLRRVVVRRGGVVEHSWTFSDPQPLPPQPWQIDEAMTGRR